jgi:hypothetical protein
MLLLAAATRAQNLYGTLTGNVTDSSEAAVAGAKVEALNMDTGVAREVLTDERGAYSFNDLQFRAEMYNLMNRVQFDLPNFVTVVDTSVLGYQLNPNLGKITAQHNSPRNKLMMLKYMF